MEAINWDKGSEPVVCHFDVVGGCKEFFDLINQAMGKSKRV